MERPVAASDARDERVLVLAPTGRDARLISETLARAGMATVIHPDLDALCAAMLEGAGAVLLAEEALTPRGMALLAHTLQRQAVWSDLPLILATGPGDPVHARARTLDALEPTANVLLLERPVRAQTLVSTLEAALRARRRQYTMRLLLVEQSSRLDELREERALRERFLSAIAHDLRGPLTGAKLAARRLTEHPERLDARRDLAIRIERNLERADRMIQDLLDFNRIRAGQGLALRIEECDLASIAAELIEDLRDGPDDRVVLDAPDQLIGWWSGPEIRRALWNLVSNGLKYGTPATPVHVTIRRNADRVVICVHNEGVVLTVADRASIFEPFNRTDSARATGQRGWGLGLTLVRGCAEGHHGRVSVESTPSDGTTFTLDLPLDARPPT